MHPQEAFAKASRKTRWLLALDRLSKPAKVRTAIGVTAAYAAAHVLLLHPLLGDASGILGIAPVLVFAMLFGARGGALAGALALPFLMLAAVALSDEGLLEWLWPAGLLGASGLVVVGSFAGLYRDMTADLKAAHVRAIRTPGYRYRMRTSGEPTASGRTDGDAPSRLDPATVVQQLSEREADVLRLVAAGLPNQEIADTLGISLHTAKTHVSVILRKLAVSNRTSAVGVARELELID